MNAKQKGAFGERAAEKHLARRGYRIISNNFLARGGEIDLIGYRAGVLVYFEVKTRSGNTYGTPASAIGAEKIAHIRTAAAEFRRMYVQGGRVPVGYPCGLTLLRAVHRERIDAVEVYLENGKTRINHITDMEKRI